MVLSLLMLAAAATTPIACAPPAGAQALVSRPSLRWLLLGEAGHGTNEMPRTLADLVCAAAAAHRPVTVAIEFRALNQPWLDAFMASNGGPAARAALLNAPMWDPDWADGKSSRAMLSVLDWLRRQNRRGVIGAVIAFDADMVDNGADRERQMAARLQSTAPAGNDIVIVYTGSFHALIRTLDERSTPYPPMGSLLPRQRTIAVRVQGSGGRNWACGGQGCGEMDAGQTGGPVRRLSMRAPADGGYDGEYDLGVPVTPSLPVKLQAPAPVPPR